MCISCWEEQGSPKTVNEKVLEASKLIGEVYDFNSGGGNLHIVLDDWNLEASDIDWCLKNSITENTHDHTTEQLKIERRCATQLRKLPIKQRASALAIFNGYFTPNKANGKGANR